MTSPASKSVYSSSGSGRADVEVKVRFESLGSVKEAASKSGRWSITLVVVMCMFAVRNCFLLGQASAKLHTTEETTVWQEQAWETWLQEVPIQRELRMPKMSVEDTLLPPSVSHSWDEALLHPTLLALEEAPRKFAVWAECDALLGSSLLEQILQYKTVESITVLESPFCATRDDTLYGDARVQRVPLQDASRSEASWDVLILYAKSGQPFLLKGKQRWFYRLLALVKGVVLAPVGKATLLSRTTSQAPMILGLEATNLFASMSVYEQIITTFESKRELWNFGAAFVDGRPAHWFANHAFVEVRMRKLLKQRPTTLDAPQLQAFHYPSRVQEFMECPNCLHGFDPNLKNIPKSALRVGTSTIPNAGRGVFTNEDIDKGSTLSVEECIHTISVPHEPYVMLEDLVEHFEVQEGEELDYIMEPSAGMVFDVLYAYFEGYGFSMEGLGRYALDVDPGLATFMNHGCNGTFNLGAMHSWTEWEYNDLGQPLTKEERWALGVDSKPYSPYHDRNVRVKECREEVAMRDIQAGEELFNNYMEFAPMNELESYAMQLQQECTGGLLGTVSVYEATLLDEV